MDGALTGSTSLLPYVATMSISQALMYYWAKAFPLKSGSSINGVKISTDGTLLIVHSGNSNNAFIVVFESRTGYVKSARTYSSSLSYFNYDKTINSIILSSSPSPVAYVLSKIQASSMSCSGQ